MLEHLNVADFGTPKRESAHEVTLEIDGNQVTVPQGTSLMRAAVDAGELPAADWALSIDRDRVHDGRPQLYGSQGLPSKDGKFAGLQPIEDEDHVDERRAALGMEPLAAYKAALAREYDR